MSTVQDLTKTTFSDALEQPGVLVVDFSAPWCSPCRAMAPHFERAARVRPQHGFAKVDVDEQPVLAEAARRRSANYPDPAAPSADIAATTVREEVMV